jgi:hypothetical protein
MIRRPIDDRGVAGPRIDRTSARSGHSSTDRIATAMVMNAARKEDRTAKPAPGPM